MRGGVIAAIVIVLNIFFVVLRTMVFTTPDYDTICPAPTALPQTEDSCAAASGIWNDTSSMNTDKTASTGYCDLSQKCQAPYQKAIDDYQLRSFSLMVVLGIVALIIGMLPLGSTVVSLGLTYGGVLSFVIASILYWSDAASVVRLFISLVALGALIYLGLKKFRD